MLLVGFHPEPVKVDIELSHPASWISHFRVWHETPRPHEYSEGYETLPGFFGYRPSEVGRHPWLQSPPPDPYQLPRLEITTQDEMSPINGATNDFWADFEARDTVVIQSSDQGLFGSPNFCSTRAPKTTTRMSFNLRRGWIPWRRTTERRTAHLVARESWIRSERQTLSPPRGVPVRRVGDNGIPSTGAVASCRPSCQTDPGIRSAPNW